MERQLIEYLPHIVRGFDHFKALTAGEQPEFCLAWKAADALLENQFVLTARLPGLSRWEKLLHLTPGPSDSIEIRRNRILLRLRQMLAELCGEGNSSAEIEELTYLLTVTIDLTAQNYVDAVMELLERMVPANLLFGLYVLATAAAVTSCCGILPAGHGGCSKTSLPEKDVSFRFAGEIRLPAALLGGSFTVTALPAAKTT